MNSSLPCLSAMIGRCICLIGCLHLVALISTVEAGATDVAADQAYHQASAGERLIIDVRTPGEWRQTGLPETAVPVSLHHEDGPEGFLREVLNAVGGDRSAPISLICRTGNRSQIARSFLIDQGFTNVHDVAEGVVGGPNGPGWLSRGLPTEACAQC